MTNLNNFQHAISNNDIESALHSIDVELDSLNLPELASLFDSL